MVDDAIRSLRNLFLLSLTVGLIWLLSWSSAVEGITLYRYTLDLHAWLFLKAKMAEIAGIFEEDRDGIFSPRRTDSLSQIWVEDLTKPIRGPEDVTWVAKPLAVPVSWPSIAEQPIRLEPEAFHATWDNDLSQARVYRVALAASQNRASELPLSDYRIVFFPIGRPLPGEGHNPAVIPLAETSLVVEGSKGQRQLEQIAAAFDRPRLWDELALHLIRHGFNGHPTELTMQDGALAALRAESDVRMAGEGIQVVGIRFNLRSFFTVVGFVLAAIAFAMLGPVLALREGGTTATSVPWILAVRRGAGLPRRLLEDVVIAVTLAWSGFPLAVLFLQISTASEFRGVEAWLLWIGAVGLVFAFIVHGMASLELRAHRARAGHKEA